MKITDTWLQAAIVKNRGKPKYRRSVSRGPDRPGLMVTVYSNGTAGFEMRYTRPDGQRAFMPFGNYGRDGKAGLSLAEACEAHDAARKLLARGLDPIEERDRRRLDAQKARADHAAADTVASLVEQFVHRRLRAERWDDGERTWVRDPRSRTRPRKRPEAAEALLMANLVNAKLDGLAISRIKARDITRRQLVRLLDAIVDRGAPVTANRVHALLVQLFDWATAKDIVQASPAAGIEPPGGVESPRSRTLSADEIRNFWVRLDTAEAAESTKLALKLLLVTGQRRGEITFARWDHFDLEAGLWTIPVELLKSAHARREGPASHVVPLSPLALELLIRLKALTGAQPHLLPGRSSQHPDNPYSARVLSRAVRENEAHFGIPHFTPHDLRRTAASFMTKLKVPRLHVEKVLNHSTGDIAEVYDRHDYLPEKRAALERWSSHLEVIIARDTDRGHSVAQDGLTSALRNVAPRKGLS